VFFLSCIWSGLEYNVSISERFTRWTSVAKRTTFLSSFYSDSVSKSDYVFIDVTWSKKLIPKNDVQGREAITDRSLLDSLFRVVNKFPNGYRFILCDVFLERETEDDSAFHETVRKTQRIIFPYQYVGDRLQKPVIKDIPSAYSSYTSSSGYNLYGGFLKYKLISEDTLKGIPLRMFETLQNTNAKKSLGLTWIGNRPAFNTNILDLRLRKKHLVGDDGSSLILPLEELFALPNDTLLFNEFLRDKIIVIGNFEEDVHQTVFGKQPGTLILINIYEAIRHGDIYLNGWLIMFVVIVYTALSYFLFFGEPKFKQPPIATKAVLVIATFGGELSVYSIVFYLISLITYFIFGTHLDIFAIAIYFSIIATVKKFIIEWRKNVSQSVNSKIEK
jgi:hypothetical protein